MLSLLSLFATVVIAICRLVSSQQNKLFSCLRVLLACYFSITAFNVVAIDQIDITAASVTYDEYDVSDIRAQLQLNSNSRIDLKLQGKFLSQQVNIHGDLQGERWQASTIINSPVSLLLKDYETLFGKHTDSKVKGDARIELAFSGKVSTLQQQHNIDYKISLQNTTGELPEYFSAFENLGVVASGHLVNQPAGLNGNLNLQYNAGLLAYKDLLIEPVAGPLAIKTDFKVKKGTLHLKDFNLEDPGGLHIDMPEFIAPIDNYEKRHAISMSIVARELSHVYKFWAQPLLFGTVLEDIETEGTASLDLQVKDTKLQRVNIDVRDTSLADKAGRFSLYQLYSHFDSQNDFETGKLEVRWDGAELYRLLLGKSAIDFKISDHGLSVTSPFTIPLYDGSLKIFKFSAQDLHLENPVIQFDGVLTPVSLSALSDAMGWPAFQGTISGVIPGVRYENSALKMDGVLLARAFDGTFKIQHLNISDLLSPLPRLSADLNVSQLDLEKLTRAFDFGRIDGRLSGYIAGLSMVAWKAQAFDAFFFTPENDKSKHIISQRAVDNLTSLSGSDIGSVLSRSYLRFFENFRYDRLGIGCVLRNNICRMNGIAAASGSSYYIVKGGILPPKLDIVGYSHEVDWQDLLGRLKRVMSDNAPLIQ